MALGMTLFYIDLRSSKYCNHNKWFDYCNPPPPPPHNPCCSSSAFSPHFSTPLSFPVSHLLRFLPPYQSPSLHPLPFSSFSFSFSQWPPFLTLAPGLQTTAAHSWPDSNCTDPTSCNLIDSALLGVNITHSADVDPASQCLRPELSGCRSEFMLNFLFFLFFFFFLSISLHLNDHFKIDGIEDGDLAENCQAPHDSKW